MIASTYAVTLGGRRYTVQLNTTNRVTIDDQSFDLDVRQTGSHGFSMLLDGHSHAAVVLRSNGAYTVMMDGVSTEVQVESERDRLLKKVSGSSAVRHHAQEITAPMPALVVRVEVSEGMSVRTGQGLVVLEAMKMENEIKATGDGVIKHIAVSPGSAVEKGQVLVILE